MFLLGCPTTSHFQWGGGDTGSPRRECCAADSEGVTGPVLKPGRGTKVQTWKVPSGPPRGSGAAAPGAKQTVAITRRKVMRPQVVAKRRVSSYSPPSSTGPFAGRQHGCPNKPTRRQSTLCPTHPGRCGPSVQPGSTCHFRTDSLLPSRWEGTNQHLHTVPAKPHCDPPPAWQKIKAQRK